ncbi:MAG: STAS domain-containing protein [Frankiaceae bacterium]
MTAVPPALRVMTTRAGAQVVVALAGELDLASAPFLLERLSSLDGGGSRPARVLIDAGSLTFIDVAGVRALCALADALAAAGTSVALRRSTPQLDRLLRLLGIGPGLVPGRS